jgi:tetratricopeptide (TPR) repeat protein
MPARKKGTKKSGRLPWRFPTGFALLAFVALALATVGVLTFRRNAHPSIPDPDTASMEPQVAAAISEARERVSDRTDSAEAWGALGMVFQAHDLFGEASESYSVAEELDEGDFRWPYLKSRSLVQLQEIDLALASVRRAMDRERRYAPLYVLEAELHEKRGSVEEAIASYRRALEISSDCAAAELGIGRLELDRGNVEKSLEHLERARDLQPDAGAIQATLARAYHRASDRERARAAGELARALHPEVILDDRVMAAVSEEAVSLVGYQRRAAEAHSKGDFARAEALLRRIIALDPGKADHHYNLANSLSRQGREEDAEASYREALALDPDHVSGRINLGIVLSRRGKLGEAKLLFESALALEPENAGALSSLAKVAALEGDGARAIALFERALARSPDEPETHYALAQVLRQQGRLSLSLASFERALALAPDRADIHFEKAVTCAQTGDYRSAWTHLHRAQEIGFTPPREFVAALADRMPEPPNR